MKDNDNVDYSIRAQVLLNIINPHYQNEQWLKTKWQKLNP